MMDDTHYFDGSDYWIQASYDLRPPAQWCGQNDSSLCLLNVNPSTGALVSAKYTPWTAYNYGGANNGGQLAWIIDPSCNHPYNDFAFATVDFQTAQASSITWFVLSSTHFPKS